jgi:hypothetical protein
MGAAMKIVPFALVFAFMTTQASFAGATLEPYTLSTLYKPATIVLNDAQTVDFMALVHRCTSEAQSAVSNDPSDENYMVSYSGAPPIEVSRDEFIKAQANNCLYDRGSSDPLLKTVIQRMFITPSLDDKTSQ